MANIMKIWYAASTRTSFCYLRPLKLLNFRSMNASSFSTRSLHTKLQTPLQKSQLARRSDLIITQQKCVFHTTPRQNVNPIIFLLTKPVGKIAAIISGRIARKSWQGMSPEKKAKFKAKLFANRRKLFALGGLAFSAAIINFVMHIQETPITKRKRFIAFTPEQFMKIAQFEYDMQFEGLKDQIVSPKHPIYNQVVRVAQKIVDSNQDYDFFTKQAWTVIVVNSPLENAFVLPTGHIFVFTGLLRICSSDDLLAVVLGHEMAHALLSHGAEQVSFAAVVDWLIIMVMAGIWFFMPNDGIALVTQWFYNKVVEILLNLPYSRKLEEEADEVGLKLAAKACYDIRHSSALWDMMELIEMYRDDSVPLPDWLSTHPGNKTRVTNLNELIPKALQLREECRCCALPKADPREEIKALRLEMEEDAKAAEAAKQEEEKSSAAAAGVVAKSGNQPHVAGALTAGTLNQPQVADALKGNESHIRELRKALGLGKESSALLNGRNEGKSEDRVVIKKGEVGRAEEKVKLEQLGGVTFKVGQKQNA